MRIKKQAIPAQPAVWLLGLRPASQNGRRPRRMEAFWQWVQRRLGRIWPQKWAQTIGRLPNGLPVCLLELPYNKNDFLALPLLKRRQLMLHALNWLNLPSRQARQIGMALNLQSLLPGGSRPPLLADGWKLAAQEFVRQTAAELGGLHGKQTALLGVEGANPAERYICAALLAAGSRPVLYGSHALGLAEYYYQKYGIAIPVFGARKAIRSSQVIMVLKSRPQTAAAINNVFYFREPHVSVPGNFFGRFSFGSFPAGQAAALLKHISDKNGELTANITLDK